MQNTDILTFFGLFFIIISIVSFVILLKNKNFKEPQSKFIFWLLIASFGLVYLSNFKFSSLELTTEGIKATLEKQEKKIESLQTQNERLKLSIDKIANLTWNSGRLAQESKNGKTQIPQETHADQILKAYYGDEWQEEKLKRIKKGEFRVPSEKKSMYIQNIEESIKNR